MLAGDDERDRRVRSPFACVFTVASTRAADRRRGESGSPAWGAASASATSLTSIDGKRMIDFLDVKQETIFAKTVDRRGPARGGKKALVVPTRASEDRTAPDRRRPQERARAWSSEGRRRPAKAGLPRADDASWP